MSVLDKFLERSNADGQIYPVQYYDVTSDSMKPVATDSPLPVRNVNTSAASDTTTPASISATPTVIVPADADRLSVTLLNTGTTACLIKLGGVPSTTNYDYVLKADTGVRAGAGGEKTIENYTGTIQCATESGTTTVAILDIKTS